MKRRHAFLTDRQIDRIAIETAKAEDVTLSSVIRKALDEYFARLDAASPKRKKGRP